MLREVGDMSEECEEFRVSALDPQCARETPLLLTQHKKAIIHQVTTMLSTSKNVLFPCHNHLLTTGSDNLTL